MTARAAGRRADVRILVMTHSSRTAFERAVSDARRLEAVRFLIRGGLLPAHVDEQFWRRLKFIVQATHLGLSVADIRQLLQPCTEVGSDARSGRAVDRRAAVAS
jgi:hypothetical protein